MEITSVLTLEITRYCQQKIHPDLQAVIVQLEFLPYTGPDQGNVGPYICH